MIPLIDPELEHRLRAALQEAVSTDPALDAGRRLLLLPVELLQGMAEHAPGALGDDARAMERLRLLLSTSATHAVPADLGAALRGPSEGSMKISRMPLVAGNGLLHLGALTIVGLAAGRVGRQVGLASQFLETVQGLALSSGPAEVVARALTHGMDVAQLRLVLSALSSEGAERKATSFTTSLTTFFADPLQRARWACLLALFDTIGRDVEETEWEATLGEQVLRVEPRRACDGSPVEVYAHLSQELFARLVEAGETLSVVFGQRDAAPLLSPGKLDRSLGKDGAALIHTVVPDGAGPGPVGLHLPDRVSLTNEARKRLRELWSERNAIAWLAEAPVPVEEIPLVSDPPSPPDLGLNEFLGGRARVRHASLTPQVVEPGGLLTLSWDIEGATSLQLLPDRLTPKGRLPSAGVRTLPAPLDADELAIELVAQAPCEELRTPLNARVRARFTDVQLVGSAHRVGEPVVVTAQLLPRGTRASAVMVVNGQTVSPKRHEDAVTFSFIPDAPGLLPVELRLGTDLTQPDDSSVLRVAVAQWPKRRVVVLRPPRLEPTFARVSWSEAVESLRRAGAELQEVFEPIDADWVTDDALDAPVVDAAASPSADRQLEALADLACRHVGFEDAAWIALFPGSSPFSLELPAEAAERVAVCTPSGLTSALNGARSISEPTLRLRLLGTLFPDGTVQLDVSRTEVRAAGTGAPHDANLQVAVFGRDGYATSVHTVHTVRKVGARRFSALVAISEESWAVELRAQGVLLAHLSRAQLMNEPLGTPPTEGILARVSRSHGTPSLNVVEVAGHLVQYDARHTRGVTTHVSLEQRRHGGWVPLADGQTCGVAIAAPTMRLGALTDAQGQTTLRLVGTDGWNTVEVPVSLEDVVISGNDLRIRRARGERLWLDHEAREEASTPIEWRLGTARMTGNVLRLPPAHRGEVSVIARGVEARAFIEAHVDAAGEAPDADARH